MTLRQIGWRARLIVIENLNPISSECTIRIVKWGNSLAVRLTTSVVEALSLKEGDDIVIRAADWSGLDVARKPAPEDLLQRLRAFRGRLLPGFKLDRDKVNWR